MPPRSPTRPWTALRGYVGQLRASAALLTSRWGPTGQCAETGGNGKPSGVLSNLTTMTADPRSGVSVSASLRTLGMVEIAEKHQ
jgi:hypothetical protein